MSQTPDSGSAECPHGETPGAWLVILKGVGIFGAYLEEARARESAKAVAGVLVRVPIAEDYRK